MAGRPKTNLNENYRHDLLNIAPYLWGRAENRKDTEDQIVKSATTVSKGMRITTDSMNEILPMLSKTAITLKELTASDHLFLYSVDAASQEIVHIPIDGEPATQSGSRISWPIRSGRNVAAHVTFNRECVMVNGLNKDERFPDGAGWGDRLTTSVICVPVLTVGEECYAIVELTRVGGADFAQPDLDLVTVVAGWMGSTIEQHQNRLLIQTAEGNQCRLNNIMQSFMANDVAFDQALGAILAVAKGIVGAEYAAFYRFEKPVINRGDCEMFTYNPPLHPNDSKVMIVMKKMKDKIVGLVGQCAETGRIVNIGDVTKDSRYDAKIEAKPWISMRSMIYVPIGAQNGRLGVLHMINKVRDANVFSVQDEKAMQKLSAYLVNMLMFHLDHLEMEYSKYYNECMNDVMLNRLKFKIVLAPLVLPGDQKIAEPTDFQKFEWCLNPKDKHDTINLCYKMLTDICGNQLLEQSLVYTFLLKVKKMHRHVPFSNFEHSFTSLHGVYCVLRRLPSDRFDWIEKLSMMMSSLCKNLNNQGLSNACLASIKHPVTFIHDCSYIEKHAAWLGLRIIHNTGVLNKLTTDQLETFEAQFRENIVFTDIHAFLLQRPHLDEMFTTSKNHAESANHKVDWRNGEHRGLMRRLIVMAAVIGSMYKPFRANERLTANLMQELYNAGDRMREEGQHPTVFFDSQLSAMHAEKYRRLLQIIGIPCFELLTSCLPELSVMYTNCRALEEAYGEIIASHGQLTWYPDRSINE